MQPRTGKGPSWTNESQPQYHTSAKAEEVNPKDDRMEADPAPPQDALSDLEWMRQRMAKSVVENTDTTVLYPAPSPPTAININQVRLWVIYLTAPSDPT